MPWKQWRSRGVTNVQREWFPNCKTIQQLYAIGSFFASRSNVGHAEIHKSLVFEEAIMDMMVAISTSIQAMAWRVHVSQSTTWRVLRDEPLYLYHVQWIQEQTPRDCLLKNMVNINHNLLRIFTYCLLHTLWAPLRWEITGKTNFTFMHAWPTNIINWNTVEDLYNANLETWSFALYRILHYMVHFMHYKT